MFISSDELKDYTGLNTDSETLPDIFCSAACDVVSDYIGYNPEKSEKTLMTRADGSGTVPLGALNISLDKVTVDGVEIDTETVVIDGQYMKFTGSIPCGSQITVKFSYGWDNVPGIIKLTALRIAGCMSAESDGNIGISSKSFSDSGSRVFLNSKYDRYLEPIEKYRVYEI